MKSNKTVPWLCLIALFLAGPCPAGEDQEIIRLGASLTCPRIAYRQLPLFVTIRITNQERLPRSLEELNAMSEGEQAEYRAQGRYKIHVSQSAYPGFDLFSELKPVSWDVRNEAGVVVAEQAIPPAVHFNAPRQSMLLPDHWETAGMVPAAPLAAGTTNAFTIEVGPLTGDLPAGKYQLSGVFKRSAQFAGLPVGPVELEVCEMNETELASMDKAFGPAWKQRDLRSVRGWLALDIHWEQVKLSLSRELLAVTAPCIFLNLATRGNVAAAALGEVLEAMPPEMQGLALTLRYEWMVEANNLAQALALERQVHDEAAENSWRLARVKEGKGLIRSAREIKDQGAK